MRIKRDLPKRKNNNIIVKVEEESIAWELGIEPGDALIGVNSNEIADVFDYRFFIKDEYIDVLIEKPDGRQWLLEIEKDEDEDLGIIFENGLMDDAKSCKNKCIFCFIDQLPKKMRKTLYFKDDDSRLSFLQGNYVTLTNMTAGDLSRILFYKLSPINISVHTTDLELRRFMLKNPASDKLFVYLKKIAAAGVAMNFQTVLIKGLNDGCVLEKSISDLAEYIPHAASLSIVPVGITKYRDGLYPLEPYDFASASEVIAAVEKWQKKLYSEKGTRFVYASDEFYIKAGRDFPESKAYDGFPQLENGVGMARSFYDEAMAAMQKPRLLNPAGKVTVVTGKASEKLICGICGLITERYGISIRVCAVENSFFGENITVSGLLTGRDIYDALKAENITGKVLLPANALKSGEEIFLDGMSVSDLKKSLGIEAEIVSIDGGRFVDAAAGSR